MNAQGQARAAIRTGLLQHYVLAEREDGLLLHHVKWGGGVVLVAFDSPKRMKEYVAIVYDGDVEPMPVRRLERAYKGRYVVNPDPKLARHDTPVWAILAGPEEE